jgi:hypothetical protein
MENTLIPPVKKLGGVALSNWTSCNLKVVDNGIIEIAVTEIGVDLIP